MRGRLAWVWGAEGFTSCRVRRVLNRLNLQRGKARSKAASTGWPSRQKSLKRRRGFIASPMEKNSREKQTTFEWGGPQNFIKSFDGRSRRLSPQTRSYERGSCGVFRFAKEGDPFNSPSRGPMSAVQGEELDKQQRLYRGGRQAIGVLKYHEWWRPKGKERERTSKDKLEQREMLPHRS